MGLLTACSILKRKSVFEQKTNKRKKVNNTPHPQDRSVFKQKRTK